MCSMANKTSENKANKSSEGNVNKAFKNQGEQNVQNNWTLRRLGAIIKMNFLYAIGAISIIYGVTIMHIILSKERAKMLTRAFVLVAIIMLAIAFIGASGKAYAATVQSGYSGAVRWEIDDAGLLTLKPDTRDGISSPGRLGANTDQQNPTWGWYRHNNLIKEIKVEPGVYTQGNAVALFGSTAANPYPNLKKVDLSGLDISRANQLQRMFSNVKNIEEIDLSVMANKDAKSLYNINNLFNGCTNLKKVDLGGLRTRIRGLDGGTQGCTMSGMFTGCNNLTEVNLTDVNLGGRTDGTDGVQSWFKDKNKLTKVTMENARFPGMLRFNSMFEGCTALTDIDMSNVYVSDAQYMRDMFKGCTALKTLDVSGFGVLGRIINMDGFVNGCTALETLNIDNLNNSVIGPTNSRHNVDPNGSTSQIGAKEYGRMLDIHTCTSLKTLSAKDSKVWMVKNSRGVPGSEYFKASNDQNNEVYYFTDKAISFNPDGKEVTAVIDSDRDYINLITDRDKTQSRHTTNPDAIPDAETNINIKDGDLNPHGPGYLAPGVYTIGGERSKIENALMEDTYYRIAYVGNKPYRVELPQGGLPSELELVNSASNNNTTINTKKMVWPTEGSKEIDCGTGIKIIYENVAIDANGKLHDVVVTIKKITFKDLDKVPTLSDELAGVIYSNRTDDYNVDNGKVLGDGQEYYRPVLQATRSDGIMLLNYIRAGANADPEVPGSGTQMLTGGSGTDVEFTIEIDKANDGTSFVFLAEDLDVPYAQNWKYNSNGDACYDYLTPAGEVYGAGGEGFVLGQGVKQETVQFAKETGLYKSGNSVLASGGDPNTPWSEFTVTCDAKGSTFTWTSGVGCTSYILLNTKEQHVGEITIQPEVLKQLNNGTLGAGDFSFRLEKVSTDPDGAPEPSNVPQTKQNAADGSVTFDKLVYKTDGENAEISGSDKFNYFPGTSTETDAGGESKNIHGNGSHNTITYTYKVTEVLPTDPDPNIIYDTAPHQIQIKIYTPENDAELRRGIKAEIYVDGTLKETYWHSKEYTYYDDTQDQMITLKDKWYDDSGAELTKDPNPIKLSSVKFTNKKIRPVDVIIPAQKILKGRPWKDSDRFAAALILDGGDPSIPMPEGTTTKNGLTYSEIVIDNGATAVEEGGEVVGYKKNFGAITYNYSDLTDDQGNQMDEKTFTYNIRELEPSETSVPSVPGVTYDAQPDKATVTVKLDQSDPDDPKLTYTIKYEDENGNELPVPTFTNNYDARQTIYKMEAVKNYHDVNKNTGRSMTADEFDFALKPIGDHAAIAPMPKGTTGSGAGREYSKGNESDGDIQFEDESDPDDGLVFNYQVLLAAGISDDDLHSAAGVDFEYEMYEVIPDNAVNNNDGTWIYEDKENGIKYTYDGIHHTRKITVKVRTNDKGTPADPSDDFDELYIVGHQDDHKVDFYIDKGGNEKPATSIPGYDPAKHHFKPGAEDPGAPIFLNYYEELPGEIDGDETYGLKNKPQKGTPKYDVIPGNPIDASTLTLIKPDKEGATISDDGKEVTIPGEGKYTLNEDGTITFEPEKDYVGDPTPVEVEGTDTRGNKVRATYTPHVVDPTDKQDATRTIHFTYETPIGDKVTTDVTQTITLTRRAKEVDPETGKVTVWGDWEPGTFPAVANPDKEAGEGWHTGDIVGELTVNRPGAVSDEHVVYQRKQYTVTYEDGDHGKSDGGKENKQYGDTPQKNKTTPDDGYRFTGKYNYVITDENGNVIKTGTTTDPYSVEVIGNIVFTPVYEKIEEPEEPDNPEEPDEPDNPDNPDEPDEPEEQDEPGEPDNPDEPDKPDKPDEQDDADDAYDTDKPDKPDKPDRPKKKQGRYGVATGDDSGLMLYSTMFLGSVAALGALSLNRRRYRGKHTSGYRGRS